MSIFNIIKLNATTSTNDTLKELHHKKQCKDGDLIWARSQINGRGQRNKSWKSEPDKNLTFSIYRTFNDFSTANAALINQVVATGILEVLGQLNCPALSIKWPNDILSENKKISGILIENMLSGHFIKASIIGIGINVNQEEFEGLPFASSLKLQTGKHFELQTLLDFLMEKLGSKLEKCVPDNTHYFLQKFNQQLYKRGTYCIIEKDKKHFEATIKGVDTKGQLCIQYESGEEVAFQYGEVRIPYV